MGQTTFIDAIREALRKSVVPGYVVAEQSGIDAGHLSRFLNGKARLSDDKIVALADALGFDIVLRPKTKRSK